MSDALSFLLSLARQAGQLIAATYAQDFAVEYKAKDDPVTVADKQANALIVDALTRQFPGAKVVAEESEVSSFGDYQNADRIFFVDPLDGTREFVARNGEFVVMIGMVDDDHASAGVVLSPITGKAWCGAPGLGAFVIEADGSKTPISPSGTDRLEQAVLVGSRSRSTTATARAKAVLGVREVRPLGSAGLKGAHVADGTADLYLSPGVAGYRWDACAIDALVAASGGKFSDAHGEALDYRAPDLRNRTGLLAGNAVLHGLALEKLALERARRPESR